MNHDGHSDGLPEGTTPLSNEESAIIKALRHSRGWVFTACLVSLVVVTGASVAHVPTLSLYESIAFLIIFAMMVVSNWFPVLFTFKSTAARVSVGSVAFLASCLWFGPWLSMLAAAAVIASVSLHIGAAPRMIIDNAASASLAAAAAALFYQTVSSAGALPLSDARATVGAVGAAFTMAGVSFLIFVLGVAWDTRRSVVTLARELSGGYHFFLSVPILGIIIPIVGSVSLLGLLIIPIPLALAQLAMNSLGQLQRDTKAALSSLVDALELRDPYTSFHSLRVTRYVEALLTSLPNLSEQERVTIGNAARLHDIGKVAVRDAVLLKPGPLTDEEWSEMQSHSAAGASIVSELEFYRPLVNIIRSHHERWDGRGYPDKLAAEAIPLGGRVIGIADAFDAMTTDRPYRKALSYQQAIDELVKNKGKQFDADLVDLFVNSLSGPQFEAIRSSPVEARAAAD